MKGRRGNPLFLIDIAVPRDIDPAVNELGDVFLYDIDDLNGVVESNLEERMREAEKAEHDHRRGDGRVRGVARVDGGRAHGRGDPRQGRGGASAGAREGASSVSADSRRRSSRRSTRSRASIVNKMLHGPTNRLKNVAAEKDGYEYVEAARFLYGLDTNPEGENPHAGLLKSLLGRKDSAPANKPATDTASNE